MISKKTHSHSISNLRPYSTGKSANVIVNYAFIPLGQGQFFILTATELIITVETINNGIKEQNYMFKL